MRFMRSMRSTYLKEGAMPGKKRLSAATVGVSLSALALLWAVFTTLDARRARTGTTPLAIIVSDSLGTPQQNVILVFLDGQRLEPDRFGMILAPRSRAGEEATLRDSITGRELCSIRVPRDGGSALRVRPPRC